MKDHLDPDAPCGRGKRMRVLPSCSVYTMATQQQMMEAARWAVFDVRLPQHLIDEGIQEIMFAFARHRISPTTTVQDLGKLMRTTAKRWALDIKRKLAYPVRLNPDDFFSADARAGAKTADSEIDPSVPLFHDGDEDGDLEWDFEDSMVDEEVNYADLPAGHVAAIDRVWDQLKVPEQRFFRHVLAGHSFARAGELERVSFGTAKSHYNNIVSLLNKSLES